jgi:hypothetical protein
MSTGVWNTTRLAKSEVNVTDFSCSAGSFSAITPWLPNRSHAENPWYTSALLVAAVTRARSAESARYRSSATMS